MDDRRWSSAEILMYGVLDKLGPQRACPEDAVLTDVDEDNLSREAIIEGLKAGGLDASQYYGIWSIWRAGDGFDGELLQYREITDSFQGFTLDEAAEKAWEWGWGCIG